MTGGHYTAFALHPATGYWYEYDDSYVNQVSVDTVQQCQAYVLFYTRDDTAQRHFRQKYVYHLVILINDTLCIPIRALFMKTIGNID